jgi:hypothetical protein
MSAKRKERQRSFFTEGFDGSTELAECPGLSLTVYEGNEEDRPKDLVKGPVSNLRDLL